VRAAPAARPRLVLFDIDGTLLSGGRAARSVFAGALTEVFGTCGDVETFAFEGKLDPMIVKELLLAAGVPEETVLRRRGDALALYLDRLEAALATERPVLKPGVAAVLDGVARDGAAVSALLTGNVERGARIKLSAVDLWDRFAFGAFGDEAARREDLGPIALVKARRLGHTFTGVDCVVVGDAPQDVACARALGARIVAVATGKTPADSLAKAGATLVLADLSNTSRALEAILG
jgi:phosphoglycolate phosphatase-like HAD superfamily hydrolase